MLASPPRIAASFVAISCLTLGLPAQSLARAHEDAPAEDTAAGEPASAEDALEDAMIEPPGAAEDGAEGETEASEETSAEQAEDDEKAGEKPTPAPAPAAKAPEKSTRERKPIDKKALGISVAGYAAAAIGIGLLGGMGAAIGMSRKASDDAAAADVPSAENDRIDALDRGKRADTLALALGVTGGVLVLTGAILAGVGTPRLLRSRKTAMTNCLPTGGRATVGLGCVVRF